MKQLLTLSYLFITTVFLAHAQSSADQSQFRKLVDAYNSNDSAAVSKFYATQLNDAAKIADNVKQTLSEYRFAGKLIYKKAKTLSATETELTLQTEAYGSWINILWVTDSAQQYKEHHMRPVRINTDYLSSGKLTNQMVFDSVDAYVSKLVNQKVFSGNVLIAKNRQILYSKAFGAAANNPEALAKQYDMASMGKLFTTISILQLADRGKLSLDDSVGKLMPRLQNKALNSITVRQLLTHTSGMGDYFENPDYDPMAGKTFTEKDFLSAVEKDMPQFKPGQSFRYSNTGFLLLGLIVENISRKSFTTYVQDDICKPAGMTATLPGNGSGGGVSTVTDLLKLANAIRDKKLLNEASTKLFMETHNNGWGFGQEYEQLGSEIITGHSGGFINVCTELNMYHNSGYIVVILSDTEPPFGHFISDKIKELLVRK